MKLFKNLSNIENAIISSILESTLKEIVSDKPGFIESHPKNSLLSPELIIQAAEGALEEMK